MGVGVAGRAGPRSCDAGGSASVTGAAGRHELAGAGGRYGPPGSRRGSGGAVAAGTPPRGEEAAWGDRTRPGARGARGAGLGAEGLRDPDGRGGRCGRCPGPGFRRSPRAGLCVIHRCTFALPFASPLALFRSAGRCSLPSALDFENPAACTPRSFTCI